MTVGNLLTPMILVWIVVCFTENACQTYKKLGESCTEATECVDFEANCTGICTCGNSYYDDNGLAIDGTCRQVTDLKVTKITFSSSIPAYIVVTWTSPNVGVDAISSYSIQWQPLDNSFDGNSTTAMENEANITQIIPGKAYLITVTSVNNQTELGALRTTSVSGERAARPLPPDTITSSGDDYDASDKRIRLAWNTPYGVARAYTVTIRDGNTQSYIRGFSTSQNFTTVSDNALKNGYIYIVDIRSQSERYYGDTAYSESTSFLVNIKTKVQVPEPPVDVVCNINNDGDIRLVWSAPELPNGDVIQYIIFVYKDTSPLTLVNEKNTSTPVTQFDIEGLDTELQYVFHVYTENEEYVSTEYATPSKRCSSKQYKQLGETCAEANECVDFVANCTGVCTCGNSYYDDNGLALNGTCRQVTDLKVTKITFSSSIPAYIVVTWTSPNVGVDAISSYSIQWQPLDNSFDGNSTTAMGNEANITQLIPGKAYLITVTSVNNQTELGALRTTSVSGECAARPFPPDTITSSDLDASDKRIRIEWNTPPGITTGYSAYLRDGSTQRFMQGHSTQNNYTTFSDDTLQNGYRYSVQIGSKSERFNSGSYSESTLLANIKTKVQVPEPPVDVVCNINNDGDIRLVWSVPELPNGDVLQYIIFVYNDTSPLTLVNEKNTSTPVTQFDIEGLDTELQYVFHVYTENEEYVSTEYATPSKRCSSKQYKQLGETCAEATECVEFEANCTGICTCGNSYYDDNGLALNGTCRPVTELQVTQVTFSSLPTFIVVTWTPPNVGVDAISSYSIQWQPLDNSFDGNSTTVMENEANITQLIPGKAYLITVTSVNNQTELGALRTSSVSGEHAVRPLPPDTMTSSGDDYDASDKRIRLAWNTPPGVTTGYSVTIRDGNTQSYIRGISTSQHFTTVSDNALENGYIYIVDIRSQSERYYGDTAYSESTSFLVNIKTKVQDNSDGIMAESDANLGVIVGGIIGGLVVLTLLVVLIICHVRRKTNAKPSAIELGPKASMDRSPPVDVARTRPVQTDAFSRHVSAMHDNMDRLFTSAFQDLEKLTGSTAVIQRTAAYKQSLVKIANSRTSDSYLDGHFIPGLSSTSDYIVCQGPISSKAADFWSVVLSENVRVVIMLNNNNDKTSDQYWPKEFNTPRQYGDVTVVLTSITAYDSYMCFTVKISKGDVSRCVSHFQYLNWSEYYENGLLDFMTTVRGKEELFQHMSPVMIHCSQGVEHTGTYIAVDTALQQVISGHASIDVFGLVLRMRQIRPQIVPNKRQFIFIYECVRQSINKKAEGAYESLSFYITAATGDNNGYAALEPTESPEYAYIE